MAPVSGMLAAAVRPHAFATTCFDCQFKGQSSSSSIAPADVFFAAAAAQQQQQKEKTSRVLRFGSSSCRLLVRTPLPSLSFFAGVSFFLSGFFAFFDEQVLNLQLENPFFFFFFFFFASSARV
jgi:mevalonate pyrophosphate decarboxylase